MAANNRPKIHFETVEELLGAPVITEGTQEIKVTDIFPFENHPFKVLDDEKMADLVESIKANGVLSPVLLRPDDEGTYEMISGHRRLHAAKLAGLRTIPAIVKEMTNDEAIIAMVDSNVQREEILPSERAFSLKMKMDAMRRQGARTDIEEPKVFQSSDAELTCRLEVDKSADRKTCEKVGQEAGLGGRQVQRYIRLTELIPELLDMVDDKRIGVNMAVEISYFSKEMQGWIYEYRKENGFLKQEQITALRDSSNIENLTQYTMIQLLNNALPEKKPNGKITFSERKLNKYFPGFMNAKDREKVIIELLEKWHDEQEDKW